MIRQRWHTLAALSVGAAALAAAFKKEDGREVTRLYRRDDVPDADCWVRGPGWCLAYRWPVCRIIYIMENRVRVFRGALS